MNTKISIQINGEPREFPETVTLLELIQAIRIPDKAIAVAVNSEIAPRSEFAKIRLHDRDRVEIIRAVGGG